jgi:hypothetical protein
LGPVDGRTGFPLSSIIIVNGRTDDGVVVIRYDGHREPPDAGPGLELGPYGRNTVKTPKEGSTYPKGISK